MGDHIQSYCARSSPFTRHSVKVSSYQNLCPAHIENILLGWISRTSPSRKHSGDSCSTELQRQPSFPSQTRRASLLMDKMTIAIKKFASLPNLLQGYKL